MRTRDRTNGGTWRYEGKAHNKKNGGKDEWVARLWAGKHNTEARRKRYLIFFFVAGGEKEEDGDR